MPREIFKAAVREHEFAVQKSPLAQLEGVARQHNINLQWESIQSLVGGDSLWQSCPKVDGDLCPQFLQAATTREDSIQKSAEETIRLLRRR
ncbi:hypothetical protein SISNIDRAFT_459722 [Sistotremastrum niveocremeum HHB9708]|uniref:Uncharacterized protein n=2 Tax=Sistotremastraceae TaxID=3402574 RepID=A0A164P9B4_9AGAM|nr:hypothetical protein SISNIDRAFT_459722 [Sistotremastrum niveocremeum HHB9708]KZT33485.1 hypothetical protein SISSUDRAFT_408049 [Sistotremastrum suecicum HHB10207 ss-3]